MAKTAVTLTKKKTTIRKGQLKKTIKNILCRVDNNWPEISIEDAKLLEQKLELYKVDIPNFEKPHWNKIKHLPKDKRPRRPKIEKVEGLLFGIAECNNSIQSGQCAAVVIEANVNPRIIVQSIIESCTKKEIPVVCMKELKQACAVRFGIPTSCLGVRTNSFTDIYETIAKISMHIKHDGNNALIDGSETSEKQELEMQRNIGVSLECKTEEMDCTTQIHVTPKTSVATSDCPYLYRSSKKDRIFVPQSDNILKELKKFAGQDIISFSQPHSQNQKVFKNMLLKRISNNPNRKTKKKQEKINKV